MRTSTLIGLLKVMKFVIPCKALILPQAQGFGLVTLDPFSLCELGGVWARDYILTLQGQGKTLYIMVLTSLISQTLKNRKEGLVKGLGRG